MREKDGIKKTEFISDEPVQRRIQNPAKSKMELFSNIDNAGNH